MLFMRFKNDDDDDDNDDGSHRNISFVFSPFFPHKFNSHTIFFNFLQAFFISMHNGNGMVQCVCWQLCNLAEKTRGGGGETRVRLRLEKN